MESNPLHEVEEVGAAVQLTPATMTSPRTPIALDDTDMLEEEDDEEEDDSDYEGNDEEIVTEMVGVQSPLKRYQRQFRSKAWREYIPIKVGEDVIKGQCKYCNKQIGARRGIGTSALSTHLKRCKERKKARRVVGQLNTTIMSPEGVRLGDWNFDPDVSRRELVRMVVPHELPFSIVEYDEFHKFVSSLNPAFKMLSRKTLRNDCLKTFQEQKKVLREVLSASKSRISLTMDLWTSSQTIGYMCLTCHFIDDNWKLQKRIIRFSAMETPHTGVAMFNVIFEAIQDWSCENKLLTITLDNASSNSAMVKLLKENLLAKNMLFGKGRFLHQRCAAHVLNLICQAGLSYLNPIVSKIRESVKYVRGSQTRKEKFEMIVTQVGIFCTRRPCLDVSTRLNSTFDMITTDVPFRKAFDSLELQDPCFTCAPTSDDWERAKVVCRLLKVFYNATKIVSGTKYPTAHLHFQEMWQVKMALEKEASEMDPELNPEIDPDIHSMVRYMQDKFKKYWKQYNTETVNAVMVMIQSLHYLYDYLLVILGLLICSPKAHMDSTVMSGFSNNNISSLLLLLGMLSYISMLYDC